MAVQISDGGATPHATDYADLLSKLKTFALANGWTSLEDTADKLVLQGSGSGSDEIIVAFQKYEDAGSTSYGWFINGYSGYVPGLGFEAQPGAIPNYVGSGVASYPAIPLWNSTIPYWFIVSSRRIIVLAKISTTYHIAYAGFYLPFASPGQYPYPMMIGGTANRGSTTAKPRWSDVSSRSYAFWRTRYTGECTGVIRKVDGSWMQMAGTQSKSFATWFQQNISRGCFPYPQYAKMPVERWTQAIDGSAVLTPLAYHTGAKSESVVGWFGEVDGIFHISGNGVAAEDIVTVGGVDHVVMPDVFRTGISDYAAVRLS